MLEEPVLQHSNSRPTLSGPVAWIGAGLLLFALALLPRLAGLAEATTEDEDQWILRTGNFARALAVGDWRATYQVGHPGVTTMWLTYLSLGPERARRFSDLEGDRRLVTRREDFLPALRTARLAFALAGALLVAACALLTARLAGRGPGLLVGLLLALDPFWSGMSSIVGMDSLLTGLVGCSLLCALLAFPRAQLAGSGPVQNDAGPPLPLREGGGEGGRPNPAIAGVTGSPHPNPLPGGEGITFLWSRALIPSVASGFLAGLALLTKAPALFLLPLIPLLGLLELPRNLGNVGAWRPVLLKLLLWGLGLVAAAAIWPAIWADPLGTLGRTASFVREIGTEPHAPGNFFLGQPLADPGPLFYPVALALRLGPASTIGLVLLLALRTPRRWHGLLGLLGLFVILFLAGLTVSPKKLDRYVLPVFPALGVLAALGWWKLVTRRRGDAETRRQEGAGGERRRWWPSFSASPAFPLSRAPALPLCLVVLLQLWPLLGVWPHTLAAYSPLFGGGWAAERAMQVGWGQGLDTVGEYLRSQRDPDRLTSAIWFPLFVNFQAHAPGRVGSLRFSRPYQVDPRDRPLFEQADFYVDYIHARQRRLTPAALVDRRPDFVVTIGGLDYARVYRLR